MYLLIFLGVFNISSNVGLNNYIATNMILTFAVPLLFFLHSILGPLYIRECCWGQECCKKGVAAEAWIAANWCPYCWNHQSTDSPKRNSPYQTCNLSNSWTQWTGLISCSGILLCLQFCYVIFTLMFSFLRNEVCCFSMTGGSAGFSTRSSHTRWLHELSQSTAWWISWPGEALFNLWRAIVPFG